MSRSLLTNHGFDIALSFTRYSAPGRTSWPAQVPSVPDRTLEAKTLPVKAEPDRPSSSEATASENGQEVKAAEPASPLKFDPTYAAWLGRWEYIRVNHFSNGNPYNEDTWSIDVVKDSQTESLTGQVDFSHFDAAGTGGNCSVSYLLEFTKPYYLQGLKFSGKLIFLQGTCPTSNPPQMVGSMLRESDGHMQFSIAYNMNPKTEEYFSKTMGACDLAGGGFLQNAYRTLQLPIIIEQQSAGVAWPAVSFQ